MADTGCQHRKRELRVMKIQIPWTDGGGNITLTFTGQGNGTIVVTSDDNNINRERKQVLTVSGGGLSQQVTVRQGAAEALPQGYTELEYIASTKTGGQYIDLDILLYDTLNKNYDIAIKFQVDGNGSDNNTQSTMFSCQDNTGSPWPGTFIRRDSGNYVVRGRYIGGNGNNVQLGTFGRVIELPVQTPPNKNVYNYNNSGRTHNWGTSLFCAFNSEDKTVVHRFISAKLYYFKLFVEGVLVRDMVPCINPDNIVGLYDFANGVFYSSPNGAAFEPGYKPG